MVPKIPRKIAKGDNYLCRKGGILSDLAHSYFLFHSQVTM